MAVFRVTRNGWGQMAWTNYWASQGSRGGRGGGGGGGGGSAVVAPAPTTESHPKMEIVAEGGVAFVVPYAPRETTTEGFGPVWQTVTRGGRKPLLLEAGQGLPVMSFQLIIGYPDWNASIEDILSDLQELAESGSRMKVRLDGTTARFRWRMTKYSQQVLARQHGTNDATRAICDFEFTVVSDPATMSGPASGGAKGGKGGDKLKFYIVKKGDTLQSIAAMKRVYGDASKWRKLADANKIRDPKKLKVGTRLRIPR